MFYSVDIESQGSELFHLQGKPEVLAAGRRRYWLHLDLWAA